MIEMQHPIKMTRTMVMMTKVAAVSMLENGPTQLFSGQEDGSDAGPQQLTTYGGVEVET